MRDKEKEGTHHWESGCWSRVVDSSKGPRD